MAGSSTSRLTARFLTGDYLVQARDNALSCPLYLGADPVEPSAGTITITDAAGVAVVSTAAVTITGGVATYTVPAASLPSTLTRGRGWSVAWSLTVSGVAHVFRNAASLVRSELAPVVTDLDLFRRESALDPDGTAPITSLTTYQPYIDEAWVTIIGRLVAKGNVPNLIMEPTALRELHLVMSLHLVFQDQKSRLSAAWQTKAEEYRALAKDAWDGMTFEYDESDAGRADAQRRSPKRPTFLGGF